MDMRRLSTCFVIGLALALACGAAAAPYKWVDKDGNVHYSDKPPPGVKAEEVALKPLTEVSSQPVPQSDSGPPPPTAEPQAAAAETGEYKSFRITSPADQSTLRDPSAAINIGVSLVPSLMGDDRIEFTLDGQVVASPIPGLERGTHRIGARVLSAEGGVRIAANEVTVYLHQTSILPATQTPPKPQPKK